MYSKLHFPAQLSVLMQLESIKRLFASFLERPEINLYVLGASGTRMNHLKLMQLIFQKQGLYVLLFLGFLIGVMPAVFVVFVDWRFALGLATFVLFPILYFFFLVIFSTICSKLIFAGLRLFFDIKSLFVPTILMAFLFSNLILYFTNTAGVRNMEQFLTVHVLVPFVFCITAEATFLVMMRVVAPFTRVSGPNTGLGSSHPQEVAVSIADDLESYPTEQEFAVPELDPSKREHVIKLGDKSYLENELLLLEAQGNYVAIGTRSGTELERETFQSAMSKVPPDLGIQVHRSAWVAFAAIDAVKRSGRSLTLVIYSSRELNVARSRHRAVREAWEAYEAAHGSGKPGENDEEDKQGKVGGSKG